MPDTVKGLRRGDVLFTTGGGVVGGLIRHGTASDVGHCGTVDRALEDRADGTQLLRTVEAWPDHDPAQDGPRYRTRDTRTHPVLRAYRPARTPAEVDALCGRADAIVRSGARYGWGEIARIVLRMLGIRLRRWDSPARVICSNQAAQAVLAARPDLDLGGLKPFEVWPGRLEQALAQLAWADDRAA